MTEVWRGANWFERETFDLFGVRFRNHPDLRRIMLPDDWEGHPLRKDYDVTGRPGVETGTHVSDTIDYAHSRSRGRRGDRREAAHHGRSTWARSTRPRTACCACCWNWTAKPSSKPPDIGYLHTGIEKEFEVKTYQQGVTLTDRIDYLAPLSNNLCYCLAAEKLLGLEIPPLAQWMRVMLTELTRLNSHLVWLGTHAIDIGAMSVFLYCFREREDILRIFEMFSGQRMMTSYFRIGGLALEPPRGWQKRVQEFHRHFP